MIDEPQVMDPLKTFDEIMEEKTEELEQEKVEEKKEEESEGGEKDVEIEEAEQDDYDKLDPEIRKMIDLKI